MALSSRIALIKNTSDLIGMPKLWEPPSLKAPFEKPLIRLMFEDMLWVMRVGFSVAPR